MWLFTTEVFKSLFYVKKLIVVYSDNFAIFEANQLESSNELLL